MPFCYIKIKKDGKRKIHEKDEEDFDIDTYNMFVAAMFFNGYPCG